MKTKNTVAVAVFKSFVFCNRQKYSTTYLSSLDLVERKALRLA